MTKWQKEVYQLLFRRYCLSSMKWLAAREDERQANEIRVDADIPLPAEPAREEARLPEALKPSEEYERLIDAAIPYLRAKNANSGIIDIPNTLPTFVVGDIHARPESLLRLFETRIPEFGDRTVGELLATSAVNVVCLGDFFHTEEMGNWLLMKYGADMGLTEYGTIVRSVAQQRGISSHEAVQLLDSAEP